MKAMKINGLKTLATALGLALIFSTLSSQPSSAGEPAPKVTLSQPTVDSTDFNAIATWDVPNQKACLYSAKTLSAPSTSQDSWVDPGHCTEWQPPEDTKSGIYVASWNSGESKALLVISAKPDTHPMASMAVIVPDYTWQAYDLVKNGSFYFDAVGEKTANFSDRKLNLLRPLSFNVAGDPKHYPVAPQVFPFNNPINFLREHVGNVDVIAQSQLDEHEYDLGTYKTLVLYGHDEYWTAEIKTSIESAVATGSSLLNLSGNTGYRKLVRNGLVIGFDPTSPEHPATSRWGDMPGDTTSSALIGAEYLGMPFNKRSPTPIAVKPQTLRLLRKDGLRASISATNVSTMLEGMKVSDASNPLFASTGLKSGQFFGVESHVMSIEVDAVPETASGAIEPKFLNKIGNKTLTPLATVWVNPRAEGHRRHWRAGVLIESKFGEGKVFTAGSIGWTAAIVAGDKTVQQITLNALKYLGARF